MDTADASEPVQPIESWVQLSDRREAAGNYLGACDAALLGLEQHPQARPLQYRAVLNLSRSGASKHARQLWLQYRLQPDLDDPSFRGGLEEHIAALGARLDREEAYLGDDAQRPIGLKRAAQHYEKIYRRSQSPFPGINAAVLHELSGDSAQACELAARVVADTSNANPKSDDEAYQLAADRAAASLLLGDLDAARTAIEHAAALAGNVMAIASTRKQLMQICDHKGFDPAIASALRNRTVIHYTGHMIAAEGSSGRFPAHAEARVAEHIRAALANNNVGHGYGSLACGADTLIVEALLNRGGDASVVLPFEANSFRQESVARAGGQWLERFDRCLRQAEVTYATDGEWVGDAEVFAYASRLAMGLAIVRAQQLCSEAFQLAVWDGQDSTAKAGTFSDIQAWRSHGLKTVTIGSEGNLPANMPTAESPRREVHPLPRRKVRALMFGDFHGFSRLNDRQLLTFYQHVIGRLASILEKYAGEIITRNTWGDGLFLVFGDLAAAARCALELQSELAGLDLPALELPATLGLRLGLDAGAVFEIRDPILKSPGFTGSHVMRTARLEPSTPPGEVYVTEAFAALITLLEPRDLTCEYVGMMKTPKNYGRLRTYLLRRRADARAGLIGS
jgi:class 3 adenylate cyclase